ncbi:TetR/AcrR family transcriptional regulator [Streptomyces sp. NPDC048172]|uniref:TetR/AcrR family transcriptional regulator n=1 Tax=Streptomyces sp. NPDC048172 TaxID=3365505 RepID=UPI00371FDDCD
MDRQQQPGPKRSDAQRNRERILEVALAELTRAPDVPLSAIARKAGVGQGTFYRNFPSREALTLEIYRHEMTQVARSAAELLATRAPDAALRAWMDRLAEFALAKSGLADAIHKALNTTGGEKPPPAELQDAAEVLLRACEEAGTIREGVTPDDFILAITGLFTIEPDERWKERSTRLLDLIMDGLRTGAPTP